MTNRKIALDLARGEHGNFKRFLGEAYLTADSDNAARLQMAFPHVFTSGAAETFVIVTGNAFEGLVLTGPFIRRHQATSIAENFSSEWKIATVFQSVRF